jgi:transcriptional regulator with XRE-family HTH domain
MENYSDELRKRLIQLINLFADGELSRFCKLTQINYQSATNWIKRAKSIPGAENIMQICRTLDVSPAWLLAGQGPIQSNNFSFSRESVWNRIWKTNPDFFDSKLAEYLKEGFLNYIEQCLPKRKDKSLKKVIELIFKAYDLWCNVCEKWIEAVKEYEDFKIQEVQHLKDWEFMSPEEHKKIEEIETPERNKNRLEKEARLKKEAHNFILKMNESESEINTLLKVFIG